jgi:hypothetical protein
MGTESLASLPSPRRLADPLSGIALFEYDVEFATSLVNPDAILISTIPFN